MTAERRGADALHPEEFALKLLRAGETFADAAARVRATDPGEVAFGTTAPGVLGELCRHLHGRWSSALRAREAEARDQADRIAELAGQLRKVTETYVETDLAGAVRIADASDPRRGQP